MAERAAFHSNEFVFGDWHGRAARVDFNAGVKVRHLASVGKRCYAALFPAGILAAVAALGAPVAFALLPSSEARPSSWDT